MDCLLFVFLSFLLFFRALLSCDDDDDDDVDDVEDFFHDELCFLVLIVKVVAFAWPTVPISLLRVYPLSMIIKLGSYNWFAG